MSRLFRHRGRRARGSFTGWGGLGLMVETERTHPVLDVQFRPGLIDGQGAP